MFDVLSSPPARRAAPVRHARTLLCCSLLPLFLLSAPFAPGAAHAQVPAAAGVTLDIPAGPLETALAAYVRQSGINLSFDPALLAGRHSPGVRGQHQASDALTRLLAGSRLQAVPRDGGYVLVPLPEGAVTTLSAVQVQAGLPQDQTEGSESYVGQYVSLGKGQTVRELPQSVSVMTSQRIQDQNLRSLEEVLANTPGVTVTYGANGGNASAFHARGFEISKVQVDGASVDKFSDSYYSPNLAMYDSVQVVRGADGLFSGTGEPGGAINLVRKRPTAEGQVIVDATLGSWRQRRIELDAAGPLIESGRIRGRALVAHDQHHFYYDDANQRNTLFYGIVEADVAPDVKVSLGASHERERAVPWGAGLPRQVNGDSLGLPRSTSLMAPWNRHDMRSHEIFAQLDAGLAGDWRLKAQASYVRLKSDSLIGNVYPVQDGWLQGATPWALDSYGFVHESTKKNLDVNLSGSFGAWGQRHHLLVGADWSQVHYTEAFANTDFADGPPRGDSVYDFNPDLVPAPDKVWIYTMWPDYGARETGIYARLRLHATERLAFVAGGRYSSFKDSTPSLSFNAAGEQTRSGWSGYSESGIFTPYGGVVYDLSDAWTTYASVTEIHKSQANRMSGPLPGTALDPITGRNYEIGLKGELDGGRYVTSAALYRIERNGQAVRDPNYPSTNLGAGINCCWLADGKVVSQGVEAELTGEVLPGWRVAASYTFNHNENRATGLRSHTVTPRHQLRLWTTYRLPDALAAWTVGGGVNVQSASYTSGTVRAYNPATGENDGPSIPFDFTQGGYAVWNLMAQYRVNPQWTVSVQLNNLFDRVYYKNVGSISANNWYGEPRNVLLSLRGQF